MKKYKVILGVSLLFLTASIILPITIHLQLNERIGIEAIRLMYDFNSLDELSYNMNKLKEITTPKVYHQVDINYDRRVINLYFKFKADPTHVDIISTAPNSVCYRIKNKHVSETRTFLARYKLHNGKICELREYELITGIDDFGGVDYE